MKILILGHGRSGKDTVAHFLAGAIGLEFKSSSEFACERVVYPTMPEYASPRECFLDRHSRRDEWYTAIKRYNENDKSRLCRELLQDYDMYVGMRDDEEYEASKHLFDVTFWVHAFDRVDYVDTTMHISPSDDMIDIENNGGLSDLFNKVLEVMPHCKG